MKRISLIAIIPSGSNGNALLRMIYEQVKKDIPKSLAKKYPYRDFGALILPLEQNSQSYKTVMSICEEHQLHPSVFQTIDYTKTELERFEYYQMDIPTPLELEGTSASDYGTKYTDMCPLCGLGGKLSGDILVDCKLIKNRKIGTLFPDIFVSEDMKNLIAEHGFTGISFDHEVKDFKGRQAPRLFAMEIHSILPEMSPSTWIISDTSSSRYHKCGHQVAYLRSDIQYEREKLKNATDFNLSAEYLDNYRMRKIIVSARVRKALIHAKCSAHFTPVTIL